MDSVPSDVVSRSREPGDLPVNPKGGMPMATLQLLPRIWGPPIDDLRYQEREARLLARLRAIAELRRELDAIEEETVRRRGSVRFEDVARALGISKSAAHRRWGQSR